MTRSSKVLPPRRPTKDSGPISAATFSRFILIDERGGSTLSPSYPWINL